MYDTKPTKKKTNGKNRKRKDLLATSMTILGRQHKRDGLAPHRLEILRSNWGRRISKNGLFEIFIALVQCKCSIVLFWDVSGIYSLLYQIFRLSIYQSITANVQISEYFNFVIVMHHVSLLMWQ